MKFPFFSSTTRQTTFSTLLTCAQTGQVDIVSERAALASALYSVLEGLPQSFKDPDYLKHLCEAVLQATPRLRFVWTGFSHNADEKVIPHLVVGEPAPEVTDWRLPQACFHFTSPYSQAALESIGSVNDLNSLFQPWAAGAEECPVSAALAIPLRAEKQEIRGLMVFYADELDYFSQLGSPPFQAFSHVAESIWQQSNLLQILTQKAQMDDLTGLMNRRKILHSLQKSIARAENESELLSIILLRIDGFEKINAHHGWNGGDAVLAAFARQVSLQMRSQDRIGRWTGVEFLCVLPRTDLHHAQFLAYGLQAYFLAHPLMLETVPIHLNLQTGIATYSKQAGGLDTLLQQATLHLQICSSRSEIRS